MQVIYTAIPLAPLLAAIVAGLFGKKIGRDAAHWVTTGGVGLSFLLSVIVAIHTFSSDDAPFNETVYSWAVISNIHFNVGFMIDNLTALMMLIVTFVSLMVHIYTIGYMHDDPGYQRFFSYISLFTFSMLMLVMSNNFLQLFFGWEAVGLVSYLLIGFWFKKESAIYANMKAFIVNRIGDFGFLLGIAVIITYYETLDYQTIFEAVRIGKPPVEFIPGVQWSLLTVISIFLFIGAMGKSAQVPLHVWLPDSMEGPTPISALIHAATMVTAGIFMVARMSPIFEMSDVTLNFILIIGATTAFFMGLIGIVQNDIKRVIAYSTLSQLGYMTVALGASAYSAAIFHLMTHAFFKALLFLAAGSVIMAMHHEQDIRKMGGLKKYMPTTYWTFLIGALALIGFPGFSGFFSKDVVLEAVHGSNLWASGYAYTLLLLGVFVTALYTFRLFFLVFHGEERMDDHTLAHLHESPRVITVPLILLAIPSVIAGFWLDPLVMGDFFQKIIHVNDLADGFDPGMVGAFSVHENVHKMTEEYQGIFHFILTGLFSLPFWFAMAGVGTAWFVYMKQPDWADVVKQRAGWLYRLLDNKYYLDQLNQKVFASGALYVGSGLAAAGERLLIDGLFVNGSARLVERVSRLVRRVQTGYLYHYAFAMLLGILVMMTWFLFV